jgi:hypothetical protein
MFEVAMDEKYDTIEETLQDLTEALEVNLNIVTATIASILERLRQREKIEIGSIEDVERNIDALVSTLSELKEGLKKDSE